MPANPEYLGDGVYVKFDGYGYELMADDHEDPSNTIYLETKVLRALIEYDKVTMEEARNGLADR